MTTAEVAPLPEQAYIYIIGPSDGPQKIGKAADPQSRLQLFQTGNHLALSISATFAVTRDEVTAIERYAHCLLSEYRVRGEWFNVSPTEAANAIQRAIEDVRSGKTAPTADGTKNAPLTVRMEPRLREALSRAAMECGLPLASYVQVELEKLMIQYGYLQETEQTPK